MRKLAVFLFFCIVLSPAVSFADEFAESRLNSGIRNSEISSYLLLQEAQTANEEQAAALLGRASAYSPDLPAVQFGLARARFALSYSGILESIDHVVAGINAYSKNFWWSFSLAGAAYLSLVLSFIVVIFIIVIVRIFGDLPLLAHEIEESRQNIVLLLILFVFSLISPLLFLAGILVLLGLYMPRIDKALVYLFLAFLLTSPFVFRTAAQFLQVSSSGAMKAIVEVNESKGNAYALSALKSSNDPTALFSYGLALKRSGLYDEAMAAYDHLIKIKADAPGYVNLGNVYVGQNRLDDAVRSYLAAVSIRPLASAYYNLSQVSREGLDFEKGNEYFNKALEIDRNAVTRYRAVSGRNPNRIVADEAISSSSLWDLAWKTQGKAATFNLSVLPGWAISAAALLMIFAFFMMNRHAGNKAYRCRRCNGIFCPRCEKHIMWGQMCPQCFRSLIKLEEIEVKERVAQLLSIYEHQTRRRNIMRLLSFIIPGSSQVYAGKILYGFFFMWPFIFFFLFPFTTYFMSPDARGTHWVVNFASLLIAAILLVISNIFTRQRISKGWL
ncbi:MAG: tetratricopeptide repeat protein [Nitrospirae bacterium]|nr:tetratricopeptide repeat protein [Nitrospirota bacterium]